MSLHLTAMRRLKSGDITGGTSEVLVRCLACNFLCWHNGLRWLWLLAHLLFLTCHWLFILGVIGTSSLLISAALMWGRNAAGSTDFMLHPSLSFKAENDRTLIAECDQGDCPCRSKSNLSAWLPFKRMYEICLECLEEQMIALGNVPPLVRI